MRFQGSWKTGEEVSDACQENLNACVRHALDLGITHIETARGYGTSEFQLGRILPDLPRDEMIVQTKVGPEHDVKKFIENFEMSMNFLKLDHVDLFAFHGINNDDCVEAMKTCYDQALQWQKEGRLRHIGFSTHGDTKTIIKAINAVELSYVNLHWYYIFQDNWAAVQEATKHDMGVFIISPNDKGGLLYKETKRLAELTAPLHPMVFNGLFCLSHPEVHTLSCGVAKPTDFDLHMETVELLDRADEILPPIVERLEAALDEANGADWMRTWQDGLPDWSDTPGEVNIPVILRMLNLVNAFDMVEYGQMRYNMLGSGGHWFPGAKVDAASPEDLQACVNTSPHADVIPDKLARAHALLAGEDKKRLQED
jgi:hypothetical protein